MHAKKVSHKLLENCCGWVHAKRLAALEVCVLAAIEERRLSVTGLGRAIDSAAREKHCIKRADRLLSNRHLWEEWRDIYQALALAVIGAARRPVLLIDWSDLDAHQGHVLLRASVAAEGRALSVLEEVHTLKTKDRPRTHRAFLKRLKAMLPEQACPIIVTDSGFRTPWFREVERLGWDWVGRIRNRHMVRMTGSEAAWRDSKTLHTQASARPKYLGQWQLTRRAPIACHFVLYKGKAQGRSKITCQGVRARSKHSEQNARRAREPWLLATSLPVNSKLAQRVVRLYAARMQIEEAFRDVKSQRYGLGFELNGSRDSRRLQILLLIAMIATLVVWLLGMAARLTAQHRHYQANTETRRPVLSLFFVGLRVSNDPRFQFEAEQIKTAGRALLAIVQSHGEGW